MASGDKNTPQKSINQYILERHLASDSVNRLARIILKICLQRQTDYCLLQRRIF